MKNTRKFDQEQDRMFDRHGVPTNIVRAQVHCSTSVAFQRPWTMRTSSSSSRRTSTAVRERVGTWESERHADPHPQFPSSSTESNPAASKQTLLHTKPTPARHVAVTISQRYFWNTCYDVGTGTATQQHKLRSLC